MRSWRVRYSEQGMAHQRLNNLWKQAADDPERAIAEARRIR
jgi:hypothetical protein